MYHRGALPVLLFATACGCSAVTTAANKINPFHKEPLRATAGNPAVEVACIWQPGEGRNAAGIPCRGFTGQVFFFTQKDATPALVDGDVRVYLFADRGSDEDRSKPLHQYDFTPEAWGMHATQTALGPGYSVFVPYPENDPYQARCQIRLRFQAKGGGTLYSENVTLTLDGRQRPNDAGPGLTPTVKSAEIERRSGTLQELNGQTSAAGAEPRRLKTSTFSLDGRGALIPVGHEQPAEGGEPARRAADSHPLTRTPSRSAAAHPLTGEASPAPGRTPSRGFSAELGGSMIPAHPLTSPPAEATPRELPTDEAEEVPTDRRFRLVRPTASSRPAEAATFAPAPETAAGDAIGWHPAEKAGF